VTLTSRLLGANPSIQVSTLLSGSLSTPSAKGTFTVPGDYVSIASTVGDDSSFVGFSNIPQTYKHLQLRVSATSTGGSIGNALIMRVNDSSSANYSGHKMWGTGGSNTQQGFDAGTSWNLTGSQSARGTLYPYGLIFDFPNYSNTSNYKSVHAMGGGINTTNGEVVIFSGLFHSTLAITALSLLNVNYTANATFSLYGIAG
jgi:hypothetical protein